MDIVTDEGYTFIRQKDRNIKPKRIIEDNSLYEILEVPENYIINDYNIVMSDAKLKGIIVLNVWHPNASDDPNGEHEDVKSDEPPEEQLFCLPENMLDFNINDYSLPDLIIRIEYLLETWNYNNSYWKQWLNIQYKEQRTINMDEKNEVEKETINEDNVVTTKEIIEGLKYSKSRSTALKIIKLKADLEMLNYSTYRGLENPNILQKLSLLITGLDKGHDHFVGYLKWRNDDGR